MESVRDEEYEKHVKDLKVALFEVFDTGFAKGLWHRGRFRKVVDRWKMETTRDIYEECWKKFEPLLEDLYKEGVKTGYKAGCIGHKIEEK